MTKIPDKPNSCMRVLDLFSGIGGFSLAAHWIGWETVAFCERDKFCQRVLAKHWPNVPIHDDILSFANPPAADLVCGGFPCQPFSLAGSRRGSQDDRYLWPAMLRVIQTVRPTWVVGENVAGGFSAGLADTVLASLGDIGYACRAYDIPASAVGAIHYRERIWFVATDTSRAGWQERYAAALAGIEAAGLIRHNPFRIAAPWDETGYPDQSAVLRMADGLSEGLDPSERNARIKALGNSIVPQVAYQIFRAIEAQEGGRP